MKEVDHIAIQSRKVRELCEWYSNNFNAKILYCDESWAFLQFKNIKLAIVKPSQHPPHIAFETSEFSKDDVVKLHRDHSRSCYKRDPSGNIYELIKYGD